MLERQFFKQSRSIKLHDEIITKLSKIKQSVDEPTEEYYSIFIKLRNLLLVQPENLILRIWFRARLKNWLQQGTTFIIIRTLRDLEHHHP